VAWWKPSSASAELSLRSLWLFDGLYFSCLNIALLVTRRSLLRLMMAVLVGNALALSVFGTVQKLAGSSGIYFGSVRSPQDYFFASFVYDNHWASFTLLSLGACAGLMLRQLRTAASGGLLRGPIPLGAITAVLLAVTIPLSGARLCTLLLGVLTCIAAAKAAPKVRRAMGMANLQKGMPALALAAFVAAAAAGAWFIASPYLGSRASKTREQVTEIWAQRGIGARGVLYRDTWRMATARPLFGWGMGSYPSVFAFYNTQSAKGDHIPVVYHDAHSDWLQCAAELGLAGVLLIGAAVALPALSVLGRRKGSLPYFLFVGCALVGAYAWIEFPFGNVAVVLTWWFCYFGGVQYCLLSPARTNPGSPA
jgi:O-antigen ligase